MMRPKMNRRLRLEEASSASDGAGGRTTVWSEVGILWGEVKARSGREIAGIGGAMSKVPLTITLRAAPFGNPSRPKAGQRFKDGTRIFDILAVADHDADARFLICFAEEESVA